MSDDPGFGAIAPVLACNNVLATAYWYRDVLGFGIDDKCIGEDWGMLWAQGSQVFLSQCPKLLETAKGHELLIACRDVDATHAKHQANGAKIVWPLETQPYGLREYTVDKVKWGANDELDDSTQPATQVPSHGAEASFGYLLMKIL